MKLRKVTFKKDLLIDSVLAALIVVNVPKLIHNYFPTLFGTTNNYIEAVIGGASAYLVGMITGKTDIANVGIALAAAGIANDFISPMIAGTGSTAMPAVIGDYVQLSGSQRLANYNNSLNTMNYPSYVEAY